MVIVAGDKIVGIGRRSRKVTVVSRTDGKHLWSGTVQAEGATIGDGLAAAGGIIVAVTDQGEVICLGQ